MGTHPIFESDFDCLTDKMKSATGYGRAATGYGRARVAQLNPHSRNNNQSPPATTGSTLAGQKCEIDALTEKIKQATLNGRYGTPEKSADKSSDSGKGSPETSSRESS